MMPIGQRLLGRVEETQNQVAGVSVRTKILGIILALTVGLGLWMTLQVRSQMMRSLVEEMENRGQAVASDLAVRSADYLDQGDLPGLERVLRATSSNHSDVRYIFVVDPTERVVASSFEGTTPVEIVELTGTTPLDEAHHLDYESYGGMTHDFAMPIDGGRLGAVRVGLADSRLSQHINEVTQQLLLTTVLVSLGGILGASWLTWLVTHPIRSLVRTTERVRAGDLSARARHYTDDEIGDLATAFNHTLDELQRSHDALAEKEAARTRLLERLISAQEEERKRIARELHDDVGQSLTSILVGLKLIEAQTAHKALNGQISALRHISSHALDTVRLLSRQLRPSALDDLGLDAALQRFSSELKQRFPTVDVDIHCYLPQRLPAALETSLYRLLQEAMTNAARHSGGRSIGVVVMQRTGSVQAIVEDDGRGFDVTATRRAGSSVGLHSMSERAELLGGQLRIESNDDGTTVYVEVPL
ncbi:MAG: HAMP domain-containing protein [Ardenticatenales bacterium]|nr:HAMP domain-containing protein [Ardenticatenales bacterium]